MNGETLEKLSYKLGMYVMIPEGTTISVAGMTLELEQIFTLVSELLPLQEELSGADLSDITSLPDGILQKVIDAMQKVFPDKNSGEILALLMELYPTFSDPDAMAEMQSQMAMFQSYVNGGYTMYTVGINPAIDFESQTSFDILDEVKAIANEIFGETGMRCYFTGYTQGAYDFAAVTPGDYNMVTVISIVAILVILIFTVGGIKFPVLLVALIEFGIWLNLIMQYIFSGGTVNFMSYLVITAVQLGATVDYAILITTKFRSLRKRFEPRQAAYLATTSSVMSVLTSALIMAGACFSIFAVSSNLVIQEMTFLIARGALISAILVIFVLPALLSFADKPKGGELHIPRTPKLRPIPKKRRKKYVPQLTGEGADRLASATSDIESTPPPATP